MLIDWFTVGAQILNFLVLMALLKIFLYDRVIGAMDERERKITDRLEDADRQRQEAEDHREAIKAEKRSLEEKRNDIMNEAREAARAKREELEREAREEVEDLKRSWSEALAERKQRLAEDLRRRAVQESLALTRRIVASMVDEDFSGRVAAAFAARLRGLERRAKEDLAASLNQKKPAAIVVSDGEMDKNHRQKITRVLREEIHPDLDVDYRTDGDLLGGIELRLPGKKISWSPRQYIDDLEETVLERLEAAASEGGDENKPRGSGRETA